MFNTSAYLQHFRIVFTRIFMVGAAFLVGMTATAQTEGVKNKSPFPVKYTSEIDRKILLKTLVLAPVYDNVNGIYAQPIQKLLTDLLQNDKVWGYTAYPETDKKYFVEQYDSDPAAVLKVLEKSGAQGMLTAFITKGSNGLTARLKLFTQDQGYLLIEESFQDAGAFEVSRLREQFNEMYRDIKNKLPYRGYVLSRRGQDVTLNLGSMNGVKVGQELSLAQILKINRHPKSRFMVGVEKEIIAKVQVTKVEEYLSFAKITFEKENGVVENGAKVLPSDFISYPLPKLSPEGDVSGDIPAERPFKERIAPTPETRIVKQPEESSEPTETQQKIGIITAQAVLATVKESTELRTGANYEFSKSWTPGFYLGAQIYYTEGLFMDFNVQYHSFSAKNPLTPTAAEISYSYMRLNGAMGYDYVLPNSVILTGAVGFSSYRTEVSDNAPTALTDSSIDALALQLKAAVPLDPITLGVKMDFAFAKRFSESPVNSGNATTSVTNLGVFGLYPFTPSINGRVDLAMNKINTEFSGNPTRANPASSSTIELVNLHAGIEYVF